MVASLTSSSQFVHLVSASVDTFDAVPPQLTRSISDLRELDAVLAGSLDQITAKLNALHRMMLDPSSSKAEDRLRLLRRVTDETRAFRRAHGVEDKIRVATNTCESVATSCGSLSTLSSLLLSYVPKRVLPMIPSAYATDGIPLNPTSALARRQQLIGEEALMAAQFGANGRRQGALSLAHPTARASDLSRGQQALPPLHTAPHTLGLNGHPQQHPRNHASHNGLMAAYGHSPHARAASNGNAYANANGAQQDWAPHQRQTSGLTAVDAVREKKKRGRETQAYEDDDLYQENEPTPRAPAKRQKAAANAHYDEHALPALPALPANGAPAANGVHPPAPAPAKKAAARRKPAKQVAVSATAAAVVSGTTTVDSDTPPPVAVSVAAERVASGDRSVGAVELDGEIVGAEGAEGEVEDQEVYCFCQTPSYGEMIGCDRDECEKAWFHLPCVGLKAIPKGSWYCDDCLAIKRAAEKKPGKRR